MRLTTTIAALFLLATTLGAGATQAAPPSAMRFYADALAKTNSLRSPEFVNYEAFITATGGHFDASYFAKSHDVEISEDMERNNRPEEAYSVAYRASDGLQFVRIKHDRWNNDHPTAGPARIGYFDPTWRLAQGWGQRGNLLGVFDPSAADSGQPHVTGSTVPNHGQKTILVVSAVSPGNYNVYDNGSATCANGDKGHAVRLTARTQAAQHPLLGAVIDLQNGLLCAMRYALTYQVGAVGVTGYTDMDYAMHSGYWTATAAHIAESFRGFGITVHSINVDIRYTDYSFPTLIDASTFTAGGAGQ